MPRELPPLTSTELNLLLTIHREFVIVGHSGPVLSRLRRLMPDLAPADISEHRAIEFLDELLAQQAGEDGYDHVEVVGPPIERCVSLSEEGMLRDGPPPPAERVRFAGVDVHAEPEEGAYVCYQGRDDRGVDTWECGISGRRWHRTREGAWFYTLTGCSELYEAKESMVPMPVLAHANSRPMRGRVGNAAVHAGEDILAGRTVARADESAA